jgi:hypothetical protein
MNISRKFAGTRGRKFLPLHATPPNTGEPKIRKKHMKKSNPYSSWTSTPDVQALTPNSVQIWRVPVQMTEDTRQVLESSLAPDERERAGRFHLPADRNRFLAAHGSLRDILARTLDCEAHQLEFSKGEHGKPCLVPEQGLEFNLAHSGDFSLIALARGRRVGIDVERVRSPAEDVPRRGRKPAASFLSAGPGDPGQRAVLAGLGIGHETGPFPV